MSSPYPAPGTLVDGKYRIEGYIGEGGMGAIATATHVVRQAQVALKFIAPHVMGAKGMVERFVNEAVAASKLKSEHIVQVFDVGKLESGEPYMVLELLVGHDMGKMLELEGHKGLEPARAAHLSLQVARALEVAHAAGVVHRDLKPTNCFLVEHEGDHEFVKLLDFGISKVEKGGASVTQTGHALGTPLYMSPEQARSPRDVDFRTDIWSAGVILYELLCGTTPYMVESGEVTAVLYRLFTAEPPPLDEKRPGLPAGLTALVHKALARDPNERFTSAREMALALVPYCDARSDIEIARLRASASRPSSSPRLEMPAKSYPPAAEPSGPVDVTAATQAGPVVLLPTHAPPSPAARTDLSSTSEPAESAREERASSNSRGLGKAALFATLAGGLALSVVTVVALRSGGTTSSATSEAPPTRPSAPVSAPTTSVPVLAPAPSAPVAPSATPSASAAPSAVHSAPSTPATPQHLNEVTRVR